ncbi:MAG: T9SS type A sorting domain-containing protein [Flavobacteriales bacterium]|jgi:hypothetical protein|nr:T9SS type A sorting domain-containing protein [Flavobacteriales bacterium]
MRNIISSLTLAFIFLYSSSFSQTIESSLKIGGSYEDKAWDIVKDNLGNIYITGGFSNSVDFNPNGNPNYHQAQGVNSNDIFVAKYDESLHHIWSFALGGQAWEKGAKLLVDDSLNVYIIGKSVGNIDFDPSNGVYSFDCSPSNGFIAKYNENGTFKAVNRLPSIATDNINTKIFIDHQNNIFTYSNDYLSKFNSTLQLIWTKKINGNPELLNKSVFYAIKNFKTPFYSSTFSEKKLLVEKHDLMNGDLISNKLYGLSSGSVSGGFIKRTKNNKLIIYGKFWGTMSLYGNNDTISISNLEYGNSPHGKYPIERDFIAMFDTLDNIHWAKNFNGKSPEPYLIETDNNGNIYTVGFINFKANFDPDDYLTLTNAGFGNYIAKYDSNFKYCASSQFLGGSYNDFISGFKIYNDTAIICGHFLNTINLDLNNSDHSLTTDYLEDIFIARYSNFDILTNPISIFENNISSSQISVSPNPSTGIFNLHLKSIADVIKIKIYDLKGKVILSKTTKENFIQFDLSNYPPSIYFLNIISDESFVSKKIIKIR